MHLAMAAIAGALVCFVSALPVLFDARVPGKPGIVAASSLRGTLVGLLAALLLPSPTSGLAAAGLGLLCGLITAIPVVAWKGAAWRQHARYILPSAALTGIVIGLLVQRLAA